MKNHKLATLLVSTLMFSCDILAVEEGDTTTIHVTGVLVDAPECTVGTANQITVDFGDDIITRRVDGVNYRQIIDWPLDCQNLAQTSLSFSISGVTTSFDTNLLDTTIPGLGIRLYADGAAITPGQRINFIYGGQPELAAVLIAENNATLATGPFTGTGTMVIYYQ